MQPRYSNTNQVLHWLTAACMLAILPLAWVMTNASEQMPGRDALFNWHKTLGGVVLLLTAFRVIWRFRDGPPPYPPQVAKWDQTLAHAVYWLFFLTLLWMPITGEAMTLFGTHPTVLFNVFPTPQIFPPNKAISGAFAQLHNAGQWAVYALLALHIGAVAVHLMWGKDGVLGRMLPAYAGDPPSV